MASKFNKGDVSEGILAAAITARFISKTKNIEYSDVINVIKKLKKAKASGKILTSTTKFESTNSEPRVVDEVICKVSLAKINMTAFLNTKTYMEKEVQDIVRSSIAFANGKYIKEFADKLYKNNQLNIIEVLSEGLLDQTGTKVDLKIDVDGVQVGVGISLKYGTTKQFSQVVGSKWESMETLFNALNVRFTQSTKNEYIKLLSEKKLAPALSLVYNESAKQLNRKPKKSLLASLAKFMKYHATRNEENVVLVQLNRTVVESYNFDNLERQLYGHSVVVEVIYGVTEKLTGYVGGNKIPKMLFKIEETGDALLTIRLKLEGNRVNSKGKKVPLTVRNLIEKEKAIKLIMESV